MPFRLRRVVVAACAAVLLAGALSCRQAVTAPRFAIRFPAEQSQARSTAACS